MAADGDPQQRADAPQAGDTKKGFLARCGKMQEKVEQAQLAKTQEGWNIHLAMTLRDHNATHSREEITAPRFGPYGGSIGQGRDRTADTWIFSPVDLTAVGIGCNDRSEKRALIATHPITLQGGVTANRLDKR